MHNAEVKIILDSISPNDDRLTTLQLRYWRPIHSELMTHRVFSRNAGSSRARPSKKIIDQVINDPWGPLHWGKNEPGMQANEELQGTEREAAMILWKEQAYNAGKTASHLVEIGAHKQIVNRLLEPFTYIDVVLTSTEFNNWWALRDHKDADPMIQDLARIMHKAYRESVPKFIDIGEWHLPYINEDDWNKAHWFLKEGRITRDEPPYQEKVNLLKKISAARCARVSYKLFDGTSSTFQQDLELFEKLFIAQPLHASPAEHQATPDTKSYIQRLRLDPEDPNGKEEVLSTDWEWDNPHLQGNLTGWQQFRKSLPNEFLPG